MQILAKLATYHSLVRPAESGTPFAMSWCNRESKTLSRRPAGLVTSTEESMIQSIVDELLELWDSLTVIWGN